MPHNPSRYPPKDLPFKVEEYTEGFGKAKSPPIAVAANSTVARAAFEAAVKMDPDRWIMLSNRALVMEKHEAEGKGEKR